MSFPRWTVDGGGFKLVDSRSDGKFAYVYVQFESRRKGYIDDTWRCAAGRALT
jgi:hypothetical protein